LFTPSTIPTSISRPSKSSASLSALVVNGRALASQRLSTTPLQTSPLERTLPAAPPRPRKSGTASLGLTDQHPCGQDFHTYCTYSIPSIDYFGHRQSDVGCRNDLCPRSKQGRRPDPAGSVAWRPWRRRNSGFGAVLETRSALRARTRLAECRASAPTSTIRHVQRARTGKCDCCRCGRHQTEHEYLGSLLCH
jgi:hypothetical protein